MALSKATFLPDPKDCAGTWREPRWPDGVEWVEVLDLPMEIKDKPDTLALRDVAYPVAES